MPKASHARRMAGVTCQRRCSLPPLGGKLSLCRKSVALLQQRQTSEACPRWDMYSTLLLKTAHGDSCGLQRRSFQRREKRLQGCKSLRPLHPYNLPWVFSGTVFNAWACPPVKRFEEKKQSNRHSVALQDFSSYFSYRFSPCKMFLLF